MYTLVKYLTRLYKLIARFIKGNPSIHIQRTTLTHKQLKSFFQGSSDLIKQFGEKCRLSYGVKKVLLNPAYYAYSFT